jgi:hypothetical protein
MVGTMAGTIRSTIGTIHIVTDGRGIGAGTTLIVGVGAIHIRTTITIDLHTIDLHITITHRITVV